MRCSASLHTLFHPVQVEVEIAAWNQYRFQKPFCHFSAEPRRSRRTNIPHPRRRTSRRLSSDILLAPGPGQAFGQSEIHVPARRGIGPSYGRALCAEAANVFGRWWSRVVPMPVVDADGVQGRRRHARSLSAGSGGTGRWWAGVGT